jgi:uncharacterized MnhB-related membrane protein
MTLVFACEVVLAGLLVAIATWTIVARTAFAAIVVFMVYGLLLAIVWVALSAVDVALTEAAIGGGVTSIVLLGAASRLRGSKAAIPSVSFPFKITAGVLCAVVSAGLAAVVFPFRMLRQRSRRWLKRIWRRAVLAIRWRPFFSFFARSIHC